MRRIYNTQMVIDEPRADFGDEWGETEKTESRFKKQRRMFGRLWHHYGLAEKLSGGFNIVAIRLNMGDLAICYRIVMQKR